MDLIDCQSDGFFIVFLLQGYVYCYEFKVVVLRIISDGTHRVKYQQCGYRWMVIQSYECVYLYFPQYLQC